MSSKNGRMTVWLADIRPLYEEALFQKAYVLADEARRQKTDACKEQKAKAASLGVGLLAAYALKVWQENTEEKTARLQISYSESGQPVITEVQEADMAARAGAPASPLYISLSHSGDYAACIIAEVPVGIDLQKIQPVRRNVLSHFYTSGQQEDFIQRHHIQNAEKYLPPAPQREFLRAWTAKESYMKLTGKGMALGFASLTADLENGILYETVSDYAAKPEGTMHPAARLREYPAPPGYYLTVSIIPKN